jgi:hypothetical protein
MSRKTRRVWIAIAVAGLVVVAALGLIYQRRLYRLFFIPEAPSRSMRPGPPRQANSASYRVLYVGHSLVNEDMPAMTRSIAESRGVIWTYDVQLTNGGSLKANWEGGDRAIGVNARRALETGGYDVLVLAEAVNLDDHLRWSEPEVYLNRFYSLAVEHRPDIRVYLYEVWHDRVEPRARFGVPAGGSWRENLDSDLAKWEHIVDARASERAGPPIDIIPGGQAMAAVVDAIGRGEVPGVERDGELFADDVHLSPLGNYFIALVQFCKRSRGAR